MEISWSATGTMINGIGTLLGAIAILVAAIIGRNTIRDLRATKSVERRFELAEKVAEEAHFVVQSVTISVWLFRLQTAKGAEADSFEHKAQALASKLERRDVLETISATLADTTPHVDRLKKLQPLAKIHLGPAISRSVDEIIKGKMLLETVFKRLSQLDDSIQTDAVVASLDYLNSFEEKHNVLSELLQEHLRA